MRLVGLAVVVAVSLALAPLATAAAQSSEKVPRIGVLSPGSSVESPAVQREPFERGLREFGWIPGATVVIEYRYAEGNRDRLVGLAAELVKLKVVLIVARSNPAVVAARSARKSTPIVMSSANDPVALGHVKSLARPGGTITGIANMVYELDAKRLELLKAAIPSLTRVAVLYNAVSLQQTPASSLGDASRALGLHIQEFSATKPEELAQTFAAMSRARVGAVLVRADASLLEPNRSQVTALAARHRLPTIYPWRFYVEAGGLMSYAESIPAFHHRSAFYVDRILRGANPADLPVEQPTKFELVINLKTAKALGLTIPQSVLARADQIIE